MGKSSSLIHRCLCVYYRDNEDCGCFWCVDRFKRVDIDLNDLSMRQQIYFDPIRDIQEVDPTGYVDIVKANQTSMIDVPIALTEERFNDIDDPRSIGGRPSDVFDEMAMNKTIVDYVPPTKAE